MAFFGMSALPDRKDEPKKDRDEELENLLGNLLVAKYQVMRLEDKLSNRVSNGHEDSTFIFKKDNEWYKVSINVRKQEQKKEEEEEKTSDIRP